MVPYPVAVTDLTALGAGAIENRLDWQSLLGEGCLCFTADACHHLHTVTVPAHHIPLLRLAYPLATHKIQYVGPIHFTFPTAKVRAEALPFYWCCRLTPQLTSLLPVQS